MTKFTFTKEHIDRLAAAGVAWAASWVDREINAVIQGEPDRFDVFQPL